MVKDEELVARAQKKDREAAEELVIRYQQKAYAIAYHICSGNTEEAKDLTQEAFVKIIKNIKKFRGRSSFYTWFYRIVVNTCLDGIRRRRRQERVFSLWRWGRQQEEQSKDVLEDQPDLSKDTDPLTIASGRELTEKIQNTLKLLTEKQRLVFQLKVLNEMSIREIAQVMALSEGTVKSHLFRATHVMRDVLKDWAAL